MNSRPTHVKRQPMPLMLLSLSLSLIFLCPLLWLVMSSLQPPATTPAAVPRLLPTAITVANYWRVFEVYGLARPLLNSLLVEVFAVPLTILTASAAGFAIIQLANPLRRILLLITIAFMIVPIPALWLPRFVMFSSVGLIDTLVVLMVPALMGSSPFFVLLFYWTFHRIQPDLWDAATLDGARLSQVWWQIALPLAQPTIAVVSVLTFALYWSDYLSPLVYLRSESLYTISLYLQVFITQDRANQPLAMAAVVIAILPVVILFLAVQRYFWPEGR